MNLTKITEKFVIDRPYIRVSLKKGLINYSSLARLIAKENNLDIKENFDAILIACRRYKDKVGKENNEKEILDLLKKSKIEMKNKISTFVLERSVHYSNINIVENKIRKEGEIFRLVEGASSITLIISDESTKLIKDTFGSKIIKHNKGLVEVTLKTTKEIENIPGVMGFLYTLFAEYGINIVETMSCWTDTIFIVEEKDTAKIMGLLRF